MGTKHYQSSDSFLYTLLQSHAARLGAIFQQPQAYRLQIIYTSIDRDAHNRPYFTDYYYRVDTGEYFYPASTVKLAAAALALEKLNDLRIAGLDRHTPMYTSNLEGISPAVMSDSSAADYQPSVGQYIKKILLTSDNDAFNRLYEFIGQQAFNTQLWEQGYTDVQILHRVGVTRITPEQNRHTNAVTFRKDGQVVYEQASAISNLAFSPRHDLIGKAWYNPRNELVNSPMDASQKNRLPLVDLHNILRSIIFPEAVTKSQRFRLKEEDYRFLHHCMSAQPEESTFPRYNTTEFHHNYVKFLLFGGVQRNRPTADVRSFNKPGWAYGFLTDAAYIADFTHHVEFMLSATVYVNNDGILNDRHYQFEETGKPFLRALGEIIYEYELLRTRKYTPDLSKFRFDYTKIE
ncbi:serine hydrolase [Chitinophaga rhizophila]|uniref:Class A beta-lactamase-related serine hydrolase n=1 Tax=Chitinophaga rhizophila TaxID=2866212 RepID=A0ABS7GED1_9BACT|nr:serine hydrolase [Chitinophaga rhizophila]MBW8684883.1 class A beta-lactamase-related serine hydrolase [Chitinophaga rhizophila]